MRVLFSTTANDGHFGPLLPFVRACASAGHEVRVAAPRTYAAALDRAGLTHEPFDDAPPERIGPVMAQLPSLSFDEADALVLREVFGRIDAQAALPDLTRAIERWRPDVVVRESAEIGSLAAAEAAGVPHVHACIGMHEVAEIFADAIADPLDELARMAGLDGDRLRTALADETLLSTVPAMLDHPDGPADADRVRRFHEPLRASTAPRDPTWGDRDRPLVYVTFGSVAGALPPFAGVFREALDALAETDAAVVMTVGRGTIDPASLDPVPANAYVTDWLPQDAVLAHAAAVVGHGGFGTTMGALAAGVPQVVVPLFSSDQVVNGEHVAAVGAGVTTGPGPGAATRGASEVPRLLSDASYAEAARRVADAMRSLPPPSGAVHLLEALVS
jgi:UDP:flavonoid glycosyltransferase YjiC (YdhE family)